MTKTKNRICIVCVCTIICGILLFGCNDKGVASYNAELDDSVTYTVLEVRVAGMQSGISTIQIVLSGPDDQRELYSYTTTNTYSLNDDYYVSLCKMVQGDEVYVADEKLYRMEGM